MAQFQHSDDTRSYYIEILIIQNIIIIMPRQLSYGQRWGHQLYRVFHNNLLIRVDPARPHSLKYLKFLLIQYIMGILWCCCCWVFFIMYLFHDWMFKRFWKAKPISRYNMLIIFLEVSPWRNTQVPLKGIQWNAVCRSYSALVLGI